MKQRTPGYVFIPLTLLAVIATIMMVTPIGFEKAKGTFAFFANTWKHFIETFSSGIAIGIVLIAFIMLLIVNAINRVIESTRFKKLTPAEQQQYLERSKLGYFKNLLRSSRERQTEEEEEAIILDHGFDGIKELDNALPQWWLAMFYGGCIFAVVYWLAYSFTDFAHAEVEYEKFNTAEEERVRIWIENNDITIDGAENKYADEQAIAEGKQVFENICATCHKASGGGGIGPNLTDDYWVNKVQDDLFKNIYDIVYNGSPTNPQMRAFGQRGELTGLAIEKVASYVYYLNQEKESAADGSPAQGEIVPEWVKGGGAAMQTEVPVKSDSITTVSE